MAEKVYFPLPTAVRKHESLPDVVTKATLVGRVDESLRTHLVYWSLKRAVKDELIKPKWSSDDTASIAAKMLNDSRQGNELKSIIRKTLRDFAFKRSLAVKPSFLREGDEEDRKWAERRDSAGSDMLDYVHAAKLKWEGRVRQELAEMSSEIHTPLRRPRLNAMVDGRLPEDPQIDPTLRFLYDENDILDVLEKIKSPNLADLPTAGKPVGAIKVFLRTPSLHDLRHDLADLHPEKRQIGLDEKVKNWFFEKRTQQASQVVKEAAVEEARRFLRRGATGEMRGQLWGLVLDGNCTPARAEYFTSLEKHAATHELLTDKLVQIDVKTWIANDEQFFVFEDHLEQVVMALIRDKWVVENARFIGHFEGREDIYPDSGIIPHSGIVFFAAPLCYVRRDPPDIYFLFRALFSRYFCGLSCISSKKGSILYLSKVFEDVLMEQEPTVFHHMVKLGVDPIRVSFRWIAYCFAGYLEVDQLLILWDRIVGFDSLLPVPILAAAIFSFRARAILEARSIEDVEDVFKDPRRVEVIPLLQHFLFTDVLMQI